MRFACIIIELSSWTTKLPRSNYHMYKNYHFLRGPLNFLEVPPLLHGPPNFLEVIITNWTTTFFMDHQTLLRSNNHKQNHYMSELLHVTVITNQMYLHLNSYKNIFIKVINTQLIWKSILNLHHDSPNLYPKSVTLLP